MTAGTDSSDYRSSGSGNAAFGIYNDTMSPAVIRNNLIDGGSGAYSLAIMNYDSSPVIRNNTICGGHNGADWTVADPAPLQSNDIFDCPDGNGFLNTAADINDYSLTTQNAALASEDNSSEDAALVDFDGVDDDWRLSGSSPRRWCPGV